MYLTRLSLTNFRAFTRLDLAMPRRVLVLIGANAQGKTSLLEAIYYLATFTSFHAESDRQLISFLAAGEPVVGRLVAEYQRAGKAHRLEVRLILENSGNGGARLRKEVLLDGVKRSLQEALGHFNAVIFLPQMTRILEEGPDQRRRYLNLTISQAMPGYAQALSQYSQAVTQRNALLKQLSERGGDASQLVYWDGQVAEHGSILIAARISALDELERYAARIHDRLTHGQEVLRLVYQPAFDPLPPTAGQASFNLLTPVRRTGIPVPLIRQGFLRRLEQVRSEEIARGVTTTGPHRDDLRILANGLDLGDYGSRGQIRTALMALKLAEVEWLHDKTGQWPVVLLDEILAELDIQRRMDLQAALGECEQAVLTTTDLSLFSSEFVQQSTVWEVQAGQIVPVK